MAKRTNTKARSASSKQLTKGQSEEGFDTKQESSQSGGGFFREFVSNPAVKYVAAGIATSMLSKFVTKMTDRYPEITSLLKQNLDSIETRLSDYKNSTSGQSLDSEARH